MLSAQLTWFIFLKNIGFRRLDKIAFTHDKKFFSKVKLFHAPQLICETIRKKIKQTWLYGCDST